MKIHIFDFDGVICDSNNLKTRCLKQAVFKNIHDLAANDFEKHHKLNGGISRYVKFRRITDKYNCPKNTYESLITDTSELFAYTHMRVCFSLTIMTHITPHYHHYPSALTSLTSPIAYRRYYDHHMI